MILRKSIVILVGLFFSSLMFWGVIIALKTGKVRARSFSERTYYRDKEPFEFWITIISALAIGICILCGSLYLAFHLS